METDVTRKDMFMESMLWLLRWRIKARRGEKFQEKNSYFPGGNLCEREPSTINLMIMLWFVFVVFFGHNHVCLLIKSNWKV